MLYFLMMFKLFNNFVIGAACQCGSAVITQNPGLVLTQNIQVANSISNIGAYKDEIITRAMR